MNSWPIFREGRYKGGVIFEKMDVRYRPFSNLSRRTIGFVNEDEKGAGLEYSFNEALGGQDGEALFQKIAGGVCGNLFFDVATTFGRLMEWTFKQPSISICKRCSRDITV